MRTVLRSTLRLILRAHSLFAAPPPPSLMLKLKKLPNKTSSGLDGIPPICLKHLPAIVIVDLTILFNNVINMNYFPTAWKSAKVLPILKRWKDPSDPSSYRPISLTLSISKVFEAIISDKITFFCVENALIPSHQFGFRHRYSTTHAIHKFLSHLNSLAKVTLWQPPCWIFRRPLILYGLMS